MTSYERTECPAGGGTGDAQKLDDAEEWGSVKSSELSAWPPGGKKKKLKEIRLNQGRSSKKHRRDNKTKEEEEEHTRNRGHISPVERGRGRQRVRSKNEKPIRMRGDLVNEQRAKDAISAPWREQILGNCVITPARRD